MGNLDKVRIMDLGITINVDAYYAKKTEKISDDCRDSITTLRVGFSSGDQAAYLFIAKGKNLDRRNFKEIPNNFKSPPSS